MAAADAYRRSVDSDPQFHPAWANLGIVLRRLGRSDEAVDCYRRALLGDTTNAGLWGNLGNALRDLNRHHEAVEALQRSLELRPDAGQVWRNLAIALEELGMYAEASQAYDRAATLAPDDAGILWQRCMSHIAAGAFTPATWKAYENRWAALNITPLHGLSSAPRWHGESRDGRSLLVLGEQGFGDTLLTLRYLAWLDRRDGPIGFLCQPALQRLVEPALSELGIAVSPASRPTPPHELVVPIMDLVGLFTPSIEEIPPPLRLTPAPVVPRAAERLLAGSTRRLNVGIVWSGDPNFSGKARRAVTLAPFLELTDLPDIGFFSLQLGPPREELASSGHGDAIADLAPAISDFADTAAILHRLDLLISTDTSIVHLAGGLGVPVWNLLHAGSYSFYFRDRSDCPWYPSMRLFRQPRPGDWQSVFANVRAALVELSSRRASA